MLYLIQTIQIFFTIYTLLIVARLLASWFPKLSANPIMQIIYVYTEPYLGFFRKIIPPIGGTIDISPILALFALRFIEYILIALIT